MIIDRNRQRQCEVEKILGGSEALSSRYGDNENARTL